LREYELVLIINPELDDTETESLIEGVKSNIESNGGEVLKVDPWGKKRLAFPINKNNDGYYVIFVFRSEPAFVPQLSNSFRVIESIIRDMVVLFEGDLDKLIALRDESTPREVETSPPQEEEGGQITLDTESENEDSTSGVEGENQVGEEAAPDNS
jgi:small subunit ribosomal protein S6